MNYKDDMKQNARFEFVSTLEPLYYKSPRPSDILYETDIRREDLKDLVCPPSK
jgi:hypothetical protein